MRPSEGSVHVVVYRSRELIALANPPLFRFAPGDFACSSEARVKLSLADRTLGALLGLGDLVEQDREHCHGYACGCVCSLCSDRASAATLSDALPAPEAPKQPWEVRAAA